MQSIAPFYASLPILLTLLSGPTFGQYRELLIPVQPEISSELRHKNEYFLKRELYFAKDSKIVVLDVDALIANVPITISLFDGESVNYIPYDLEIRSETIINWTGSPEWPSSSKGGKFRQSLIDEGNEKLFIDVYGMHFGLGLYEYADSLDANFTVRARQATLSENYFWGVNTAIYVYDKGRRYFIRPLNMGGPYHVIYEIDEEKTFPPGPRYDIWNRSNGRKRRDYQEFIENLGKDPMSRLHAIRRQDLESRSVIDP